MNQHQLDSRGFSLVEQLIVVTVLGLLLAASVPSFSSYLRSARVTGAANLLAADLQQTRSLATMKHKTFTFAFTATGYSIVQTVPSVTVRTRSLPRGVTCTPSGTATFFPWGLAAPVAITIGGGSSSRTVQIASNGCVSQ